MKKKLLLIALMVAIAMVALHSSRSEPVANTELTQISSLQQAVGATADADLSTARHQCFVCAKDPSRCGQFCQLEHCQGNCN